MKASTHSKKLFEKYTLYFLAIIFIYILGWWAYASINNDLVMPSPNKIVKTFFDLIITVKTYIIIGNTFLRLIISLIISLILGLVIGILGGVFKKFGYFMHPV